MTARFFLAGVDITRPRIEEDPAGAVRILLNDRDDWITVENRADCAVLMQAAADADSVFIRRRAAAEAHAAIEDVMPPEPGDQPPVAHMNVPRPEVVAGDQRPENGPGDLHEPVIDMGVGTGMEVLPVLPHRQPGHALAQAEAGHPDYGPQFTKLEQDMARLDEAAALEPGETP